jgi:hypothetical protein
LNNAAALLRAAQSGVPAIERTLGHLSQPTVAQTVAIGFTEFDPAFAADIAFLMGRDLKDLIIEDLEELVATYRSRKLLPLELGIAEPCMFGAITGVVTYMGDRAPFNPADLPSHDCLTALHTLNGVSRAIITALDYGKYSAN